MQLSVRVLSRLAVLVLASLLTVVMASASPGGGDYEDCGLLVQGPVCLQFQSDAGEVYFLENLEFFGDGDRVRVTGAVFNSPSICLPPQCTALFTGCVLSNTIVPCDSARLYCYGDGGVTPGCTQCICTNNAPQGSGGGCLNSSGTSGKLVASGTARVSADTLRIEARDLNPGTFAILISGDNALPVMGMCPPGAGIRSTTLDGLRCVGGNFQRHGTRPIDGLGAIGVATPGWGPPDGPGGGISGQGAFLAGQRRNFQIFYREAGDQVCLTGQNTTNAAEVIFIP